MKEFEEQSSALHLKECYATSTCDLATNVVYSNWVSFKNKNTYG